MEYPHVSSSSYRSYTVSNIFLRIPVRSVQLGVVSSLVSRFDHVTHVCVCVSIWRMQSLLPYAIPQLLLPPLCLPCCLPLSVDCSFGLKLATRLGLILEWSQ